MKTMTKSILLLLLFSHTLLFGQKTIRIKDKENKEVFFVLKSDKITRHGEYKKFSHRNSILVKGYYKNGVKDSIWEFYDFRGDVDQKFDFSKNELIYNNLTEEEKNKKYRLINGTDNPELTLSRPPIFLGGKAYINDLIANNIIYLQSATENKISGTVNVFFTLDKFGKTSNYHVKDPLGFGLDEESIRVIKLLPDNWLPGILNGVAVDVEYMIPIHFLVQG